MNLRSLWVSVNPFKKKQLKQENKLDILNTNSLYHLNFFLDLLSVNFVSRVKVEDIEDEGDERVRKLYETQIDEQANVLRYLLRAFNLSYTKEEFYEILNSGEKSKALYSTILSGVASAVDTLFIKFISDDREDLSLPVEERQKIRSLIINLINYFKYYSSTKRKHDDWDFLFGSIGVALAPYRARLDYRVTMREVITMTSLFLRYATPCIFLTNNRTKKLVAKLIQHDTTSTNQVDKRDIDKLKSYIVSSFDDYAILFAEPVLNGMKQSHFIDYVVLTLFRNKLIGESKDLAIIAIALSTITRSHISSEEAKEE